MRDSFVKKIDFVFFNENKIRVAVYEERNDSHRKPEIKSGKVLLNPTERDALKNIIPLPQVSIGGSVLKLPELWINVIDKTYSWCRNKSEIFFQAVRRKYNGEHYHKICSDYSISQPHFFNIIDKARMYAAMQAAQFGLIHVD